MLSLIPLCCGTFLFVKHEKSILVPDAFNTQDVPSPLTGQVPVDHMSTRKCGPTPHR